MIKIAILIALTIQCAFSASIDYNNQHWTPQGIRTLSGYDSAQRTFSTGFNTPSLSRFVATQSQTPSIIAAPITSSGSSGYGQQQQVVQSVVAPVAQSNSYGQSETVVTPTVQVSSGYNQATPVVTPTVQVSSGYNQAVPVVTPTVQVNSGYGQQTLTAPVSSYDSYSNQLSPMQLFMSQPAIQQLISTMVQQYHGNQLGASQEMANTCSVGFTQPIYESNQVTETYCRCPTGSYGFTCTENFLNPCTDPSIEFTAADSRVPSNYFLKCSWGIPYLNKCPIGTTHWSQELHACVDNGSQVVQTVQSGYGSQSLGVPIGLTSNQYGQQTLITNRGGY